MTQALNLPQDLVVFFYVCIFLDRLDVLVNHANAIIEQANRRVLRIQMIGHRGLHKRVAAWMLGNVFDADPLSLVCS